MDKIICLVGESGSGKTELSKRLEQEGYNIIKSYTTRPPREKNEWGHIFVKPNTSDDEVFRYNTTINHEGKRILLGYHPYIIAYTYFDEAHYWATKDQYQGKETSIYAIDPAGVKELKERVKDAEIKVVYLRCDETRRLHRMTYRKFKAVNLKEQIKAFKEHIRDCENWDEEISQRIDHDREAFKIIQCDYVIDANGSIEDTLKNLKEVIK